MSYTQVDGFNVVRFFPNAGDDMIEFTRNDASKDKIIRTVKESDKTRYPELWDRYCKARDTNPVNGTPLEKLPGMGTERALAIRMGGYTTVEQLAALDNLQADAIGVDGVAFRDVARLYLSAEAAKAQPAPTPAAKPAEKQRAA